MEKKHQIVILGAGPAGLYLGLKLLQRQDIKAEVTIIEKENRIGGISGSFKQKETGLLFDYGSHRLHPTIKPYILDDIELLLKEDLIQKKRNGRILLLNRYFKFPLKLFNLLLRMHPFLTAGFIKDMIIQSFRKSSPHHNSYKEVLQEKFGQTLCHYFYFPYGTKIWGLPPEKIAPIQAYRRVSVPSLWKLISHVLLFSKGVTNKHFFYPKQGFGQISNRIATEIKRLGGKILLSTTIKKIRTNQNRNITVEYLKSKNHPEKQYLKTDFLYSTIPISDLVHLLRPSPPSEILKSSFQLKSRCIIFFYLILETDRFTQYDAHYFPEKHIVFSRFSEIKNYSGTTSPEIFTGLCFEIPCNETDEIWSFSSQKIQDIILEQMDTIGLPVRSAIKDSFIRKMHSVYPVYDLIYHTNFDILISFLKNYTNIITLGRQGLFVHDNIHHTMEMAFHASDCIDENLKWNNKKWGFHLKDFEDHILID